MEEFNYKSNSHKSKEESITSNEKRVEKVVNGAARTKKSGARKLASIFLPEDVEDVKGYVLTEVIIPSAKKLCLDIIETIFYGSAGSNRTSSTASKISYRAYYDKANSRYGDYRAASSRSAMDFDDIVFETIHDAKEVILCMDECIERYGLVRVADLYDLAGITCPHTAYNYGWKDIRSAEPVRLRDGRYVIKMPRALPID